MWSLSKVFYLPIYPSTYISNYSINFLPIYPFTYLYVYKSDFLFVKQAID